MLAFFFASLGALFSVVNPLGAIPIFLALTGDYTPRHRESTARATAMWFTLILTAFFLAGKVILDFFGISLDALQIAGGLIILNSGYGLLNGNFEQRRVNKDVEMEAMSKQDISFTPMAMPMLSGPGSISLLITLFTKHPDWDNRLLVIAAILSMAALIYLTLRYAGLLFKVLGSSGLKALSRIMGFLVMSIGIQYLIYGVVGLVKEIGLS